MEYKIIWEGTVSGETIVEANSIEEAIEIAKTIDKPIQLTEYPDDWKIAEDTTKLFSKYFK